MTGKQSPLRFVLCIRNDGAEDLEPRKIYQVLPDHDAAREGLVRVIDESGEDYLYPADYFVAVKLPMAITRKLATPIAKVRQSARATVKA